MEDQVGVDCRRGFEEDEDIGKGEEDDDEVFARDETGWSGQRIDPHGMENGIRQNSRLETFLIIRIYIFYIFLGTLLKSRLNDEKKVEKDRTKIESK